LIVWKKLLLLLVVLIILGLITANLRQTPARVVDTLPVIRADIASTLSLTGTVINDHTVTITALLDGEIVAIQAREGVEVEAGETLAELDSQQATAMLDKAVAELRYERQNLESANRSYARNRDISSNGNVSRQALEDSLLGLQRAQAAVKVAEATITVNQLSVNNATIKAPFSGTVIEQTAEIGQWVEAGTQLFTLVASDGQVIEAQVDASDAGKVSLQQPVSMSSDAWPGFQWHSKVNWIAPAISSGDKANNAFAVRMALGDAAPDLLLGQQVDVELETDSRQNVLSLPLSTLQETVAEQYSVFVIEQGAVKRKPIDVGLLTINDAEIVNGLNESDLVIVPAGLPLAEGIAVEQQ
jgi:RND family efflux transporter MFP subunit